MKNVAEIVTDYARDRRRCRVGSESSTRSCSIDRQRGARLEQARAAREILISTALVEREGVRDPSVGHRHRIHGDQDRISIRSSHQEPGKGTGQAWRSARDASEARRLDPVESRSSRSTRFVMRLPPKRRSSSIRAGDRNGARRLSPRLPAAACAVRGLRPAGSGLPVVAYEASFTPEVPLTDIRAP